MNPWLFVVGCPRSGTTLLQRMLDSHPLLAVVNDSHFIHHGLPDLDADAGVCIPPGAVERLLAYRAFARLGLAEGEVRAAAARADRYAEFVGALYDAVARKAGKPLAGEKTPHYVRYLPSLNRLFPKARTIHIVRDGRDVALSTLGWARLDRGPGRFALWLTEPVAVAALSWRWHVTTGIRDGAVLGPSRYRETMYEQLVEDPEAELRSLMTFLGLPYEPRMLDFHRGRTSLEPGLSSKAAWLPPTRGLRDWRNELPDGDVELFEALAGDVLDHFRYGRAFSEISEPTAERAADCRARWEREVRARNPRLTSRDLQIEPAAPYALAG